MLAFGAVRFAYADSRVLAIERGSEQAHAHVGPRWRSAAIDRKHFIAALQAGCGGNALGLADHRREVGRPTTNIPQNSTTHRMRFAAGPANEIAMRFHTDWRSCDCAMSSARTGCSRSDASRECSPSIFT